MNKRSVFSIPGPASRYDSIDDEISADIEYVNRRRFAALYINELYKKGKTNIEILYPRIDYTEKSPFIKNGDQIRFLLSIYPEQRDLAAVKRIIIKPRHIESNGVELMALFLRSKKTLMVYLYLPHTYDITASTSSAYNEFIKFDSACMINRMGGVPRDSEMQIPPLLYILSMLGSSGNEIDKFFLRTDSCTNSQALSELDAISDFYRKNGY